MPVFFIGILISLALGVLAGSMRRTATAGADAERRPNTGSTLLFMLAVVIFAIAMFAPLLHTFTGSFGDFPLRLLRTLPHWHP